MQAVQLCARCRQKSTILHQPGIYNILLKSRTADIALIGASVSEPLLVMLTGASHIYIYYYVSYVVPHILNLSNLTHVTSIKYV